MLIDAQHTRQGEVTTGATTNKSKQRSIQQMLCQYMPLTQINCFRQPSAAPLLIWQDSHLIIRHLPEQAQASELNGHIQKQWHAFYC
jgi:hypothetical protein